jgi:hypothetical protein
MKETPPWILMGILITAVLLGIAVSSGTFGGQSDLDVFRAYVEGGSHE